MDRRGRPVVPRHLDLRGDPEAGILRQIAGGEPHASDDQIIAAENVEVCLEPTAAQMLDDKQLEATMVDGRLTFSVSPQEP